MAQQPKKESPQERAQKRIKNKIEGQQQFAEILTGKRPLPGKFRGKFQEPKTFRVWLNEFEDGFKKRAGVGKEGTFPGIKIQTRRIGKDGTPKAKGK